MSKPTTLPNQFELLHSLARTRTWLMAVTFCSLGIALMSLLALWSWATMPTPVVIWPENPHAPAQLVRSGDTAVRELDAKRFFLHLTDELVAWDSTAVREKFEAASLLMTSDWRVRFLSDLDKEVAVPKELHPAGKMPQMSFLVMSKVRNIVEPLHLEDIACARTDAQWNCKASVKVGVHPLLGPPSQEPPARMLVQASFREYPVTNTAIWGLLCTYWEVLKQE